MTASTDRSSRTKENGVKFDDFLVMVSISIIQLYNYPKEDLK